MVCGKHLIYFKEQRSMIYAICGKKQLADAACEEGRFVCDACHAGDGATILAYLLQSTEGSPIALYLQVCAMKQVQTQGLERHSIVPCILVADYHNNGGEFEFQDCLKASCKRGQKVQEVPADFWVSTARQRIQGYTPVFFQMQHLLPLMYDISPRN